MKNFLRAIRFAWTYRKRLFLSIGCAVLAAVFWGLNFTAIFPVLKILGSEKNLQDWVNVEIQKINENIEGRHIEVGELTKRQKEVERQPPSSEREHALRDVRLNLTRLESRLHRAQYQAWGYSVFKKYIDKWLPTDRFQTFALVVALVVIAVALKGFFEFWQESLVGN